MATEVTSEGAVTNLRRIELGGIKFKVPPSPTIAYMFWMRDFLKRVADESLTDDDVFDCYDQTVTFLRGYNPQFNEQALQENATLADIIGFYGRCFGANAEDGEGDGERPTRRSASGGSSSSKRSRSRSRS